MAFYVCMDVVQQAFRRHVAVVHPVEIGEHGSKSQGSRAFFLSLPSLPDKLQLCKLAS